jgi:pSer/pThr/pTyr-binding forkhead associated (FHA) protein
MDDPRQPPEVVSLPVLGPYERCGHCKPVPCDFVPLRLQLVPDSMAIELTAPDMVLGRHSASDIRLPLPDVSRRHCRFVYAGGHWQVIDLQSLNGVWVNDQAVHRSPLYPGDRLQIGSLVFTVDLPASCEPVVPPRPAEPSLRELFRDSTPRRLAG